MAVAEIDTDSKTLDLISLRYVGHRRYYRDAAV